MDKPSLAVRRDEDDSYVGLCKCGYSTSGWPMQKIAKARIRQHGQEHVDGTPMQPVSEFRADHGLVPDENGVKAVFPEGAVSVSLDIEDESEDE